MERAYVQARAWPADRAWKRAYTQMSEGQVAMGVGMYLCLLDYYARRDGIRELFETCEWILTRLESLKAPERLSVCRIVCFIVKSLKEDEFDVKEARLKLILRIPLAVILDAVAEQRLACALTGLLEFSRVFEESVTIKQCSEFEGDFLGVALAIDRAIRAGAVRDKVRTHEKTRAEYDKERLEAINMADSIKEDMERQAKAKAQAREFEEEIKQRLAKQPSLWSQSSDVPDEAVEQVAHQPSEAPPNPHPNMPDLPAGELPTLKGAEEKSPPDLHQKLVPQSTTSLQPSVDKLDKAQSAVETAAALFGPRSSQVAQSLANLIEVKTEGFPALSVDAQMEQLKDIALDQDVELSPYLMRKILSTIGNTDERQHLLSVIAIIEKSILIRREQRVGLDVSLGISLWRLICLWKSTDTLVEGQAYCDLLLQRLMRTRDPSDPVVRQVSSAAIFLAKQRRIAENSSHRSTDPSFLRPIDELAEFAAMLTVLAIDDYQAGRLESVRLVLNELLFFYSDNVGDSSRRVGEMLWLAQETSLHKMRFCTLSLIQHSQRAATDKYLHWKLSVNLKRLLEKTDDIEVANELLAALIIARRDEGVYESFEDRLQQMKEVLSLRSYSQSFEKEAQAERERAIEEGEQKAKTRRKSESLKLLSKLEQLAEKKNWKDFLSTWRKIPEFLDAGNSIYRLGQLALLAVRADQLDICERIVVVLEKHVSPSCIHVTNYLSEECARRFIRLKNPTRAAQQIERALANRHQLGDFCNCLRLQLAEIYIAMGNLFEATVLIYDAYSNIPDSESGGAPQLLLNK